MTEFIYKLVEDEAELQGAYEVRRQVFVGEQGIAEELVFDSDEGGGEINIIVKDGGAVIGTARVVFPAGNTAKIERMAVLKNYRDKGIGKGMIVFLHGELGRRQVKHIILHAQYQVMGFYQACGFKETGEPFEEAGIRHVKMEMDYQLFTSRRREPLDNQRVREIEEKIADLKARWPAHSVPPSMWQQLEDLEEELEKAQRKNGET